MPLFWKLSHSSKRPGFYFLSCMLRYQSWIHPKKLPVAIKIPWLSVKIFTSTSAYDGMHASVFHTHVSKYNKDFCSSCAQQMGSKHENTHTIPTDILFSLFPCTLKVHWRNWLKKRESKRLQTSQKHRKVNIENSLRLKPWRYSTERRWMTSGGAAWLKIPNSSE